MRGPNRPTSRGRMRPWRRSLPLAMSLSLATPSLKTGSCGKALHGKSIEIQEAAKQLMLRMEPPAEMDIDVVIGPDLGPLEDF